MRGSSPAPEPPPAAPTPGRWARIAYRYLLPVTSSGTLTWSALLERQTIDHLSGYVPLALAGIGAGALVGAVALRLGERPRAVASEPADERSPADDVPVDPPPPRLAAPARSFPAPSHRVRPSAAWAPPSPSADQLWDHWLTSAINRLPVELVGPVRETAFSRSEARATRPATAKPPEWVVTRGTLRPMRDVVEEDDRVRRATEAAVRLGRALSQHSLTTFAGRELDGLVDPTFDEPSGEWEPFPFDEAPSAAAVPPAPLSTPAPPREPPFSITVAPWTSRGARGGDTGATCASCDRDLPKTGGWQPCPECEGPVCHPCRTRAVIEHGQTWCTDCARTRAWDDPNAAT